MRTAVRGGHPFSGTPRAGHVKASIMSDSRHEDADLETDYCNDFSSMNRRMDSFKGSNWANQLSAKRLAMAGFYFTGEADRVRCFSCKKIVENWCQDDAPVERHKEVSPTCKFLSCSHRPEANMRSPDTMLTNGSDYNEEAEDLQYRLRTGEVVDETTYPLAPHMQNEDTRLGTFTSWPSSAPVRPRDLAQAGFYYMGSRDRVQCFCCGGMLGGWETGDTPWDEHRQHFPNCFFILGHDVGNIPSTGGTEVEENRSSHNAVPMGRFEERVESFAGVRHPVDPERLARAGFYSLGVGDKVCCFSCGGGLKGWQPEEDPWEEHAKQYPGCSFLLAEKGQDFINSVQLQSRSGAARSHQNGLSGHSDELLKSSMAQKAVEMGLDPQVVKNTILEKMQNTGTAYSDLETLVQDCYSNSQESTASNGEQQDETPLEKLQRLQREKQCKVCLDRDICIVFIPCGHLATCRECSQSLVKCPICCNHILQKIKTYNT
ncbi:E3 ubiquitin-protein ligase XIAP isoform X1 [Synchiropus splendidus]|uniref:E3 ubiquitin-protein ligase XIAP isoform X1 n=1 Tax=Synchiropus splendidus TaxID=270530 RepID=UPI00237DDF0E|nr:E3 ubiquitin-protein ligase XIAP isoform X1 [Synchiropus splendidus]